MQFIMSKIAILIFATSNITSNLQYDSLNDGMF